MLNLIVFSHRNLIGGDDIMWSVKGSKNIFKQIQYVSNFQDSKFISTQLFTTITRFELFID